MSKREKYAEAISILEEQLTFIMASYGGCAECAKPIFARHWREVARGIVALGGDSPDPPPDGSGGGPGFPPPPPPPGGGD